MDQATHLEWLFPIPLFRTQLEGFDTHRAPLIELAEQSETQGQGLRRSNVGGWHSDELRDEYDKAPLDWVGRQIHACTSAGLAQSRNINTPIDIQLDSSWFIINRKNNWNSPHTHMPAQWSGVLYLAVNESNAGDEGGRIVFVDPIPLGPIYRNPITAIIEPKEGLMLIFPSYLTHMVEPHFSDEARISLSFNFRVTAQNPQR